MQQRESTDYDELEESEFPAFPVVFQQELEEHRQNSADAEPKAKPQKGPFKMPDKQIKELRALMDKPHSTSYPNLFKQAWENEGQAIENFFEMYSPINQNFVEEMKKSIAQLSIVRLSSHKMYVGGFTNKMCNGMGIILFKNGNLYEGLIRDNKREGKGCYIESGVGWFEGVFSGDLKTEEGVEVLYKKSAYKGNFLNGLRHDKGLYVEKSDTVYSGQWKLGIIHGKGTLRCADSIYHGVFANSLKHGSGEEKFTNGDSFKGEYQNNRFDGHGNYTWNNSEATYEGNFKNGLRHGKGKWFSGETKYSGGYVEGLKEGYGELYFPSGNFYKGNFVEDKREGYGEMFWTDGSFYKGDWKEGIQNGKGQIYLVGGEMISGVFENSILVQVMPTMYEKQMEITNMSIHDLFGSKPQLEMPAKTRMFSQSKSSFNPHKKRLAKIDETHTNKKKSVNIRGNYHHNHIANNTTSAVNNPRSTSNHNNNNSLRNKMYFKSPEHNDHSKDKDGRECKCVRRLQNFRLKQRVKTKLNESSIQHSPVDHLEHGHSHNVPPHS